MHDTTARSNGKRGITSLQTFNGRTDNHLPPQMARDSLPCGIPAPVPRRLPCGRAFLRPHDSGLRTAGLHDLARQHGLLADPRHTDVLCVHHRLCGDKHIQSHRVRSKIHQGPCSHTLRLLHRHLCFPASIQERCLHPKRMDCHCLRFPAGCCGDHPAVQQLADGLDDRHVPEPHRL